MKAQSSIVIFHKETATPKRGRPYYIKHATHINKGKTWPKTTDAKSATTQSNSEATLQGLTPETMDA